MGQINRVPFGLQSLLDSQNFGNNPSNLVESVMPVIDIEPFMRSALLKRVTDSLNGVSAIGNVLTVEIPDGEVWLPITWSCRFMNNAAAGANAKARCEVFAIDNDTGVRSVTPAWFTDNETILDATSTSTSYGTSFQFQYPMMFLPGVEFHSRIIDLDLNGGTSIQMAQDIVFWRYTY